MIEIPYWFAALLLLAILAGCYAWCRVRKFFQEISRDPF